MTDETEQAPPPEVVMVAARALAAPMSVNEADRTVDVVWSTGARAANYVPALGQIMEELDMGAVRMDRLTSGQAPVLDTHRMQGAASVIGRVVSARVERGRGIATLQMSRAPDVEPIWHRIVEGTLRSVSVGYRVFKYEPIRDGALTVHRAVDWEPYEISLVAVPVDAAAGVRSDSPQPRMTALEPDLPAEVTAPEPPTESPTMTDQPPADSVPAADAARATQEAVTAERARISSLLPIVTAARAMVPAETVDPLHQRAQSEGWTAEALRSALWDEAVKRGPAPSIPASPNSGPSNDDPAQMIAAMADAIAVRAMPALATAADTNPRFREFANLRPSEMLMELAGARGERVTFRDRARLVERSFHTTSDFPLLLEAAGNKMLMAGFTAASPSYRTFFGQRSFADFKAHKFLMAGDFPALAELAEGGAITAGTISEKRESITPKTYARQVRITRQALVNDDLGAFTDFGAMIGRRVADYENALAYALVNTASGDGPTLSTSTGAVFTTGATRANKAASGGAISESTLDTAYAAMMAQTSLDGIKLNITPRYLLTGAAYRGAAIRYTTRVSPESGANVGLYSDLTPISDANLTGNRWYLFADPASAPVYVYGYVNGQTAPMVRVQQYVPGTDGLAIEVIHDFAVGAVDHRGGYFNPGA
jgi:hypothetical protein